MPLTPQQIIHYYYSRGGAPALFVSNAGSGDGTGSSSDNAMSLANLISRGIQENDRILLNKGEIYDTGEIDIEVAGVQFGAYGSGDNPILRGSTDISSLTWTDEGDGTWSTPMVTEPNWIWISGRCAKLAQTPRIAITGRGSTTTITVNPANLSGYSNIVGAYLVAKDKPFSSSLRVKVTDYNAGTGVITVDHEIDVNSNVDLALYNKFEFFEDDLEWAWESGELRIKSTVSPSTLDIRASAFDYCFKDRANTRFSNLEFQEYYQFGIWSDQGVSDIRSCAFHDIRDAAIYYERQVTGANVSDCTITRIGNNGITMRPLINSTFVGNTISDIGMMDNYGWWTIDYHTSEIGVNHEQGNGIGIQYIIDLDDDTVNGSSCIFHKNTVSNTAYNGISLHIGTQNTITKNTVTNFLNRYDDGGGIYIFHYRQYNDLQENTEIANNYVANSNGTGSTAKHGIYVDNRSKSAHVHHNVVEKCDWGILLNYDTTDHAVEDNITFDCVYGIVFRNSSAATLITDNTNNIFRRNLMVARKSTDRCLNVMITSGSFPSWNPFGGTGLSDNNMYLSPYNVDVANGDNAGGDLTLAELQSAYGEDANSTARANYLTQPAFWTQRLRLIVNETDSPVSGTMIGWEDFEGNSLDSYTIPARSGIVALVGDSENSVQFASASQQAVNFGTAADVQIERGDPLVLAFKIKVPENSSGNQNIFTNFGSNNRGFSLTINSGGQIIFELRNTAATNRYQAITSGDFRDNAWHSFVIKKPAVWTDTTIEVDGSNVAITEANNLNATIVNDENIFLGVREGQSTYFDGLIDELTIWLGTTDPESKYPDHFWRLGEDGYVDSGVSETKLNGTPINNPTISSDVI
jgi:parallel beta-helix repeat protein